MTDAPVIRTMTRADLNRAWAEAEGWNPGLADAEAFLAADPDGFLVAERAGAIASLSTVRFDGRTAFLGLYICRPDWRGQGIVLALWRTGIARLAPVTTGLDGVPAQEANYARGGFAMAHRNLRFSGEIQPAGPDQTVPLAEAHLEAARTLDRDVTGYERWQFLRQWLCGDPSRIARVLVRDGALAGLGVLRPCAVGWKIGPLLAADRAAAEAVVGGLAHHAGAAPVSLDVPEPNAAAMALAGDRGLAPAFETARMWCGLAPAQDLPRALGGAAFELG